MADLEHQYQDGQLKIQISGRFDYTLMQPINKICESVAAPAKVTVDLSKVVYLDSSAIGILMALREHFGGDRADITILRPTHAMAKRMFQLSKVQALFRII